MSTSFPRNFWWGTGASSTQCEGAAPASDWIPWEQAGKAPPSGNGNDFATRFAEDFELLAARGLRHHRLSIEWARIEPREGERDAAAVEHYRQVLKAAKTAGVEPWVCLHHFTLPAWFAAKGAFIEDTIRERYWRRHVAFCAETFGNLVFGWKPINEPVAYAAAGYLLGVNPPGERDFGKFIDAYRGILLAQRDAWLELRGRQPVATIHNLSPLFPAADSDAARATTHNVDNLIWEVWMRADRDGVLTLPGRDPEHIADLQQASDLIGFSYYSALGVREDMTFARYPADARVGPLGYCPWSEGIDLILRRLHSELPGRPILICEHGVGTPTANDDDAWRCDILRGSLVHVSQALRDGIDVRGFFHWTAVDNYEWHFGYDVAFGLFRRDRTARGSAALLAEYAGT
jgi:beta-glucosidase